jgi:hypothetical protein
MSMQLSPVRQNPLQHYIAFLEKYLPDPFVIAIGVTIASRYWLLVSRRRGTPRILWCPGIMAYSGS